MLCLLGTVGHSAASNPLLWQLIGCWKWCSDRGGCVAWMLELMQKDRGMLPVLVGDTERSMLLRYIYHRFCPKATLLAEPTLALPLFLRHILVWQVNLTLVADSVWNDVRENIYALKSFAR